MALKNCISADLVLLKLQLFSQSLPVTLLLGVRFPWCSVSPPMLCTLSRSVTVLSILQVESLCWCGLAFTIRLRANTVSLILVVGNQMKI